MSSKYNTKNKADLHYLPVITKYHIKSYVFKYCLYFVLLYSGIVPVDLKETKRHPLLFNSLPIFCLLTNLKIILMTVLSKHDDEHPRHFDMGIPP